ncbi:MAG: hypothetical protein KDE53_39310, partial [Caldilineaceae bacterium]|nr:hypothetical protein [Caldilineaceae bacterium]
NLPLGDYEFRIRAEDYAGNLTPWTTTTAKTFVYAKQAAGLVTDNRGLPLVDVPVTIAPTPLRQTNSDQQGHYHAYLANEERVEIQGLRQRDDGNLNYRHDYYHKSATNLIAHGDFEILDLGGTWRASGALMPTLQSAIVAQGEYALRLGGLCSGLWLQPLSGSTGFGEAKAVAIDEMGVVHVVGLVNQQDLTYWRRDGAGNWDPPLLLHSTEKIADAALAVNRKGDLVVGWAAGGGNYSSDLYVRERSAAGQWSTARKVAGGRNPKVLLDESANWHLFYSACADAGVCSHTTVAHTYELPEGGASPYGFPVALEQQFTDLATAALGLTAAGAVYFIYPEAVEFGDGGRLLQAVFRPNTHTWSGNGAIPISATTACQYVLRDHQGILHLFCTSGGVIQHRTLRPGGQWSEPQDEGSALSSADGYWADMDASDTIHLIQTVNIPDLFQGLLYFYQPLYGSWSRGQPIVNLAATPSVALHASGQNVTGAERDATNSSLDKFHLREAPRAITSTVSTVAQSLTIPADITHPTLSFMLALYRGNTAEVAAGLVAERGDTSSRFAVTVTAGITSTTVYSSATPTDWHLAWADLSAWRGETVTVTFAVQQAAGESYLQAYVNDVPLGRWSTPAVASIATPMVPAGRASTIVLQGQNLRSDMTVHLGKTPITGVTADESAGTATLSLPASLSPGVYPLYLTAAGSAYPTYGGTIYVGQQQWLPFVAR